MTRLLEEALEAVRRMPTAEQDAIARAVLRLGRPMGADAVDLDELQDVMEALAEIERGDVASEEHVADAFRAFER